MGRIPQNYTNNEPSTWIFFGTITRLKPYLTPDEFLVLMFIYDRTVRFNKRQENIPYRHFMEGINDREGRCVATRVGISKTNLLNAIRHLFQKGIIYTDNTDFGGSNIYSINDIHDIDIPDIREYISAEQQAELRRGLVTVGETIEPVTSLSRDEVNARYARPRLERRRHGRSED